MPCSSAGPAGHRCHRPVLRVPAVGLARGPRSHPIAPVSAGLRLAMLSYGFVEVTGKPVDIADITTFTVGVGTILLITGLAISAVILLRQFGTLNPRAALRAARQVLPGAPSDARAT